MRITLSKKSIQQATLRGGRKMVVHNGGGTAARLSNLNQTIAERSTGRLEAGKPTGAEGRPASDSIGA